MPSVDPISGGGLPALVGVDGLTGRVNDRFIVGMRLGASLGVDGPGEDAMVLITTISMLHRFGCRR